MVDLLTPSELPLGVTLRDNSIRQPQQELNDASGTVIRTVEDLVLWQLGRQLISFAWSMPLETFSAVRTFRGRPARIPFEGSVLPACIMSAASEIFVTTNVTSTLNPTGQDQVFTVNEEPKIYYRSHLAFGTAQPLVPNKSDIEWTITPGSAVNTTLHGFGLLPNWIPELLSV